MFDSSLRSGSPTIDLKRIHPPSRRYFIYKFLPWIVAAFCTMMVVFVSDVEEALFGVRFEMFSSWNVPGLVFGLFLLGMLAVGVAVLRVKRANYQYDIRKGLLHVRKGLFMKDERSLPLLSVTDVRLCTSFSLFFFGLHYLEVETASAHDRDAIVIEGLSRRTALAIRERIFQSIQKLQSQPWRPMPSGHDESSEAEYDDTATWRNPELSTLSPARERRV